MTVRAVIVEDPVAINLSMNGVLACWSPSGRIPSMENRTVGWRIVRFCSMWKY